jgi:hypothetical protein
MTKKLSDWEKQKRKEKRQAERELGMTQEERLEQRERDRIAYNDMMQRYYRELEAMGNPLILKMAVSPNFVPRPLETHNPEREIDELFIESSVQKEQITINKILDQIDKLRQKVNDETWKSLTVIGKQVELLISEKDREIQKQRIHQTEDGWTVSLRGRVRRRFYGLYKDKIMPPESDWDELDLEHYGWSFYIYRAGEVRYLGSYEYVLEQMRKRGSLVASQDCKSLQTCK